MTLLPALGAMTGLAFLLYGIGCLASKNMEREFLRFGLARFRVLVGVLEILGGAGLLVGLGRPWALRLAAAGLCLLMTLGVAVRVWHRDGVLLTLPAAVLMVVNGLILRASLGG